MLCVDGAEVTDGSQYIETLSDLHRAITLKNVLHERYGFRRLDPEEFEEFDKSGTGDIAVGIRSALIDEPRQLSVTFNASTVSSATYLESSVIAVYDLPEGAELAEGLERDFIQSSAVITLAPHAREALMSLAARARVPGPIMPLLGPGAPMVLQPVEPEAESDDGEAQAQQ